MAAIIRQGLQASVPTGGGLGPDCLAIERERYHLFAESATWGKNTVVSWEDEAWPFLVVDYLRHVQDCPNRFHLKPLIRHDLNQPIPSKSLRLTLVSKERFERERARLIA